MRRRRPARYRSAPGKFRRAVLGFDRRCCASPRRSITILPSMKLTYRRRIRVKFVSPAARKKSRSGSPTCSIRPFFMTTGGRKSPSPRTGRASRRRFGDLQPSWSFRISSRHDEPEVRVEVGEGSSRSRTFGSRLSARARGRAAAGRRRACRSSDPEGLQFDHLEQVLNPRPDPLLRHRLIFRHTDVFPPRSYAEQGVVLETDRVSRRLGGVVNLFPSRMISPELISVKPPISRQESVVLPTAAGARDERDQFPLFHLSEIPLRTSFVHRIYGYS